jgi:hypothetical protein
MRYIKTRYYYYYYYNIHFLVKFRTSKNSYFINNKPTFLKLRIFTNSNTVFPVVVLVFDFEEFSEEVFHGQWFTPEWNRKEMDWVREGLGFNFGPSYREDCGVKLVYFCKVSRRGVGTQ